MQIHTSVQPISENAGLIIPIEKNDQLSSVLDQIAKRFELDADYLTLDFTANNKEVAVMQGQLKGQKIRIYLLGYGSTTHFGSWINTSRAFIHKWKKKLPIQLQVSFDFGNQPAMDLSKAVEAMANGFTLGEYKIGRFKEDSFSATVETSIEVLCSADQKSALDISLSRGQAFAATQKQLIDLVNAPSNYKRPQDLSDWAVESGKAHGFSVQVMDKAEIEEMGFGGLMAVNRGSEHPATFTIMEYKPEGAIKKKVGLVGKGVTFDTGGLSIKPSSNMHFMKSDMGGAAAVFGTMEMAAKLKLPIHLIGIVPATDNSVDALAVKPGDVISSYSGKTIEIIDTDAEGRLILADGVSYMTQHFDPEVLIDLATLTGSVIRSLGYLAGGLFSNNDELSQQLLDASQRTGERLWRLPIWEEYGEMITSDMADVKNFSGKPMAGAITAAKFIEHFTHEHPTWAHLDIAGVAMSDMEFSMQKSATGFGIRLLIDFLENF